MAEKTEEEVKALAQIPANSRGLVLATIQDMYRFGQYVVAAKLAPASFTTPEQILIAVQSGAELGMPPMRSLQSLCVINGQARLYGDAPLALVRQSDLMEYIKETIEGEGDAMVAVCEVKRKEDPEPQMRKFSVVDARLAGLWSKKGVWQQYPKRMLQMRARSLALRDVFPDAFGGATIAEEYHGITPDYDPTTLRRDDRKEVESEVKDPNQLLQEAIGAVFVKFLKKFPNASNTDFAEYTANLVGGDKPDYMLDENHLDPKAFDADTLKGVSEALDEESDAKDES